MILMVSPPESMAKAPEQDTSTPPAAAGAFSRKPLILLVLKLFLQEIRKWHPACL
jgi:hypothetical protein